MDSTTDQNREERKFADRDLYRDVIGHFASGVTVITVQDENAKYGLTASAVTSLSLDPPMLLVCINKETGTQNAIASSRAFAVNILDEDQGEIAMQFARPQSDKFRGMNVSYGELDEPLLTDVLAHLECRVAEEVDAATHTVFIAEVQKADAREGTPLTYFKGKLGRFEGAENEAVYGRIRHQVLSRELPVGQSVDVDDLAYRLDAPTQAVYYALTKLSGEGIISHEPGGDFVVNALDAAALREALEARCAIEIGAVEAAIEDASDEDRARLLEKAEATLPHIQNGRFVDYEAYMETNREFHETLVSLAKNEMLLASYRLLGAATAMLRSLHGAYSADDSMVEGHVEIARGFEAGDVEAVKQSIYQHNENAKLMGSRAIEGAGGRI